MNHDKPLYWICLPVVHRLKLASPPVYQMAFIRFVSKPLVRWLSLASSCVVMAVIVWFGVLLSLGRSELSLRPWDLPNTATTTILNFQPYYA